MLKRGLIGSVVLATTLVAVFGRTMLIFLPLQLVAVTGRFGMWRRA